MKLYLSLFTLLLLIIIINSCKKDISAINPSIKPAPIHFTIAADSVILDPYGVAPLSALILFTSPVKGSTLIIVKGKNGSASDIQHLFNDTGYSHSIPAIGLYASYNNDIHLYIMSGTGDTLAETSLSIATGILPANFPQPAITQDIPFTTTTTPGINLVSNFNVLSTYIPYMADNYGDIRWLLNYKKHPPLDSLNYECGIARLRNGNFFFGDSHSNAVYEVDMLGKILNTWPLSKEYSFHHHVIEIPNGNFIATANASGSIHTNGTPTQGDYIIEIERNTGNIINSWDLKESLDEYRTALTSNTADWFHGNALLYDSTDNTIIVSGRTQGVAKLDFDNNVKWILSPHKGWGSNRNSVALNQFLLNPLDAYGNIINDTNIINGYTNATDFEWNWYQHCPIFMPNGDLMLFDDGTTRNFDTSAAQSLYSRAVEYKIDPVKMTVQQVWEYGKERGIETFSGIVSSVQYLPSSNHVLFCPGYKVVNTNGNGGKVVEVDYASRQAVFELSITNTNGWGFHRTYRIDPYPNN